MQEEFDALQCTRTWQLVPRPPRANIITGKWVFPHKTRPDGSLERYKARWVVHGFRQHAGVDFTDTFTPVFCEEPTGFVDAEHPDFGANTAYLLLYVDDIILTVSVPDLLQRLTARLRDEFVLKDLGPLHYFLGIEVVRRTDSFFLHQQKYAHKLLKRASMLNCKPAPTAVDTKAKVSALEGSVAFDAAFYRSIVGVLQYLTLTRPNLQYAVQQVCLHIHALRDSHWTLVKRILHYVCGTMSLGLTLMASASSDLVAYSDADWAGCPDTRRSTSGYCVYLGPVPISWSSKRQPTVSRSSAEAEYRVVANAVAECSWIRQLLQELLCDVHKATLVYCDNVNTVYLSANPVHHRRTKHIELDIHFVHEQVALGRVRVLHVPTLQQFADVMTKGLPTSVFEEFRSSLYVSSDASTAGVLSMYFVLHVY
nr:uncharacterized mitochondrial protein AtMg00810-like [Aegilops tauschii subsp. strangulata]